jgi:hypothetical protein
MWPDSGQPRSGGAKSSQSCGGPLPPTIVHQPRQQLGHLHVTTMLPLEGLHIELLAPAAQVHSMPRTDWRMSDRVM